MKGFKDLDKLSISDCCRILGIDKKDLPNILENAHFSMEQQPIVDRLKLLISRDKSTFYSCSNIEQYEMYLSLWPDGLFHDAARQRITQLKIEADEFVFYKTNQNCISGLENYIKRYPSGKFTHEAKVCLANKKRAKKIRNIILLIFFLIILTFVGVYSYEPLPTIQIPEEIVVSQYGDTIDFKKFIANEINDHNIHLNLNDDEYFDSSPSVHSVIYRNDKKMIIF